MKNLDSFRYLRKKRFCFQTIAPKHIYSFKAEKFVLRRKIKKVNNSLNVQAIQYPEKKNSHLFLPQSGHKNLKDFAFLSFYGEQKKNKMKNFQVLRADHKHFLFVNFFTNKKELKTFGLQNVTSFSIKPKILSHPNTNYSRGTPLRPLRGKSGPNPLLNKSINLFKSFDSFQNTFDVFVRFYFEEDVKSKTQKNFLFFNKFSKIKEFCFFLFFEILFLFFSFFQKFQFFLENLVLNFFQLPAKQSVENLLSVQNTHQNLNVRSDLDAEVEADDCFCFFCFLFFVFYHKSDEKKLKNSSQVIYWEKKPLQILNFRPLFGKKVFLFQKSFLFMQLFLQNFEEFFYSFCFLRPLFHRTGRKKSLFNKFLFKNFFSNVQKFPFLFFEKKLKKKKSFFSHFGFLSFFILTLFSSAYIKAPLQEELCPVCSRSGRTQKLTHFEHLKTKKKNKDSRLLPQKWDGEISSFFFQKFSFCSHEKRNFFSKRILCTPTSTFVKNPFFGVKTIQNAELFFRPLLQMFRGSSGRKKIFDIFSKIALQKSFFHVSQSFQSLFFEKLQNAFFWTSLKNILSKSFFLFQPKKLSFFIKEIKDQRIQPFLFFEYKNFFFFSNEKKNLCSFCSSFFENLIYTKSSLLGFSNFKNSLNDFENFFETFMKIHEVFQKEFLVEIFKKEKIQSLFQNFLFLYTFFFFENFCFQNQAVSFSLDVPYGGLRNKEKNEWEDLFFKKNEQTKKKRDSIEEKVDFYRCSYVGIFRKADIEAGQFFHRHVQKENFFFPKKSSFLSIKTQTTKVSQCSFFFSLCLFFYKNHSEKCFRAPSQKCSGEISFVQLKKSFFHFTFKNSLFFLFFSLKEPFRNLFSLEKNPNRASLKKHFNECKRILDKARGKTQLFLMKKLQKKISNWCKKYKNNFSSFFSKKRMFQNKKIFEYCDFILFKYLWNWAKKKHPNKSKQWIQKKYFHLISKKKWVFGKKIGKYLICLNLHSHI